MQDNRGPIRTTSRPALRTVTLAGLACAMTSLAIYAFLGQPDRPDFRTFYLEGTAWLTGRPLYHVRPFLNTNPPTVTVALFAPFAVLPYQVAQVAWLLVGFASLAGSLRAIGSELLLSRSQLLEITALLLITHGAFATIVHGQLTWLLLYPTTRAWICYRRERYISAGIWLTPAIILKPPLALIALVLRRGTWITAGLISGALTAAAMLVTGVEPWLEWLRSGAAISWLPSVGNASLFGFVARLQAGSTVAAVHFRDLSTMSLTIALIAGLAFGWHVRRQSSHDLRFLCAVLWSILLSPLGWQHYFPLAVGPAVATWPKHPSAWFAYAMTIVLFRDRNVMPLITGNTYFFALLCAWFSWTWASGSREPRQTRS